MKDQGCPGRRRKWSRRFLLTAAGLLCSFLACGCSNSEGKSGKAPADENETKLISVGFSQLGSESLWRTANTESVQNALTQENGYFLLFSNARQKQENQIKAIRGFISQRVDYIIFSPVTETGWDTVLKEAKDAGIPVLLVDRMVSVEDENLYTAWIGTDFEQEGENAALALADLLEKDGRDETVKIFVLEGTRGSSAQTGRSRGFEKVMADHPSWEIIERRDGDFTTALGKEEMTDLLKHVSDIDVVVSQNDDMTFGALEALQEAGYTTGKDGDVVVISFDATRKALEMVQSGEIAIDVECNPLQGPYIDDLIKRIERGETVERKNYIREEVFTAENVSQYLPDRTY